MQPEISSEEFRDLDRMIRGVARWYSVRCSWVDQEDLINEGWVWAIQARRKYLSLPVEHQRVPVAAFCRTVVRRYVHDRVLRDGTCVKAGRFKKRVVLPEHRAEMPKDLPSGRSAFDELHALEVHAAAIEITEGLPLAWDAISRELKPREVAELHGVAPKRVSDQLYTARCRARSHPGLKELAV
jgi:DNA-directed RNA polymerase specialized sigma24 family protein